MTRSRILASTFTCCPPGMPGFTGGEDLLGWNLLQQIARFHEVWALTQEEDRSSIEQVMAERPIQGLHFHYVGLPRWLTPLLKIQGGHQFYYYIWQIKAYLEARRLHKKIRFDLFHHITYANDWMVSFIGALLPVPYVRGPGGGAHRTPKTLHSEYTLAGRAWEKVRSVGQWVFRADPFFVRGQSHSSALLIGGWESAKKVPKKWSDKIHLFPGNGISSEELSRHIPSTEYSNEFNVLTAGSLIRIKGFSLAVRAFQIFAEKNPSSTLTIAGDGPEGPRLKRLIRSQNMEDKVKLLGTIPRDDLLSRMDASDVLLFPSLRDGGGAVVIEAMAAARPVVCLDVGGPGFYVADGCGIKITPTTSLETVNDLADALERLYLDKELRMEIGRTAREHVQEIYHWDKLGERLMEIYRPIIQN